MHYVTSCMHYVTSCINAHAPHQTADLESKLQSRRQVQFSATLNHELHCPRNGDGRFYSKGDPRVYYNNCRSRGGGQGLGRGQLVQLVPLGDQATWVSL